MVRVEEEEDIKRLLQYRVRHVVGLAEVIHLVQESARGLT